MSEYATRFSVQGKRALVTGASKGLGAEIAIVLADAGADLAITGRDQNAYRRRIQRGLEVRASWPFRQQNSGCLRFAEKDL